MLTTLYARISKVRFHKVIIGFIEFVIWGQACQPKEENKAHLETKQNYIRTINKQLVL